MTRLCVPIFVRSSDQAHRDLARAVAAGAETIELRLDTFLKEAGEDWDLRHIVDDLRTQAKGVPLILTCRTEREGGESTLRDQDRLDVLVRSRRHDNAPSRDLIDIEWSSIDGLPVHPLLVPFIASAHDFKSRPDRLTATFAEMNESQADVVKLAWQARSIRDNIEAFELMLAGPKPAIAICMGEAGAISRILAKKFGAFLTFASLDDTSATAPGQLTIAELKNTYRWDAITPKTKVYGVVGAPVGHSMSPAIHNAGFDRVGFDGVYLPLLVQPGYESFKAFMETFRAFKPLDLAGLSITIPHKENALRYARDSGDFDIDPLAETIGAVNTYALGSTNRAWSTDYAAIIDTVTTTLGIERDGLNSLRVAIVGAGGTGRTAVAALRHFGANVTLFNRTPDRAIELALEFGAVARSIESIVKTEADVWINTTSLGMSPNVDASIFDAGQPALTPDTLVFDTVYNPIETKVLKLAKERGAKTASGVEMFVRQAAGQFEGWTGQPAPLDTMRAIVERRLGAR